MQRFLEYARQKEPELIELIRELVECESPTGSPAGVNRLIDLLVERTRDIATAKTVNIDGLGNLLRLEFQVQSSEARGEILALGHSDTVWPLGTIGHMPFRQADGRLWGPGVLDMKSGLAFFLYAVRALIESEVPVRRRVVLLVVPDEEIGSKSSRAHTEAEARQSECVLVLEPGTGLTGGLKTSRKGVGLYTVEIEGIAAHAGVDFESGASAILEAARQVDRIATFTDLARGTTVNPGVISGGTRSNVIAAQAKIEVDVRVTTATDAGALDQRLRSLAPVDKRCRIRVEGGLNRPPMERTRTTACLFDVARRIGAELGIAVEESSSGGGSDGNFTAALGIPTLDGVGAVGEGAHAANESILIHRIADRVALLAGLLCKLPPAL